jgi:hypothetical protein
MPGSTGFSPQAGGGSLGSGEGPAHGSKRHERTRRARKVKELRQHKHPARPTMVRTPPLISDVSIGGPSAGDKD